MKRIRLILSAVLPLALGCGHKADFEAPAPEKAHAPEHSATVKLSAESLSLASLETITVTRGNLPMTIRSAGRIGFNVNRTAKVTSTFEGRVAKMNYDVGAQVHQGDVMALVDSPELLNRPLELKAPIAGQVIERHGTVGEAVDRARELYTISDLTNVWGVAEIKEKDIAAVRVGQKATIRVLAYPEETFTGALVLIGSEVEEKTRTVEARIEVNNAAGRLKPGMFADIEIVQSVLQNVLVIPDEALQTLEDQQVVFVSANSNEFSRCFVKLGREQNGRTEIIDGVKEGDRVVTKGSFILKSELLKSELGEE